MLALPRVDLKVVTMEMLLVVLLANVMVVLMVAYLAAKWAV